jgi:hypothetical protein
MAVRIPVLERVWGLKFDRKALHSLPEAECRASLFTVVAGDLA